MNRLRVALVGAGFIASNRHLPAWRSLGGKAEIVAVSDLNRGLARAAADRFGVARIYADAGEMFARERPDVVDICAPPAVHAKLAALATDHGCHVLVEKPMALTLADCDAIVQGARRRGTQVCVAHTGLFYEPFIRGRELVERGAIGEFRGMRIAISTPTHYMTSRPDHWSHKLPGGSVGETGPHAVYMSLAFLKRVASVTVDGRKFLPQYPWSRFDDYRINLVGETGISSISINYATSQWLVWVEIAGTDGTLFLDLHGRRVVKMRRKRLRAAAIGLSVLGEGAQLAREALRAGFKLATGRTSSTHDHLIRAFAASLLDKTPPPVSAEEGREAVRVMGMIAGQLGLAEIGGAAEGVG
jgi:predicted dehydrogenase